MSDLKRNQLKKRKSRAQQSEKRKGKAGGAQVQPTWQPQRVKWPSGPPPACPCLPRSSYHAATCPCVKLSTLSRRRLWAPFGCVMQITRLTNGSLRFFRCLSMGVARGPGRGEQDKQPTAAALRILCRLASKSVEERERETS